MNFCCESMQRHSEELLPLKEGRPSLGGEALRFCPWCGANLEAGAELAAAAATAAARPAGSSQASSQASASPAGDDADYSVYVDGACANNQAPGLQRGGWAAVFTDGRVFSGGDPATTNNRMELRAALEALRQTPTGSRVTVYSDSAYVVNAFLQNWFRGWEARGWRNVKGAPVENQELWRQLRDEAGKRRVRWVKVQGHAGNEFNELADKAAVAAVPRE